MEGHLVLMGVLINVSLKQDLIVSSCRTDRFVLPSVVMESEFKEKTVTMEGSLEIEKDVVTIV